MENPRGKHPAGSRFQALVDHIYGPYPDHVFLEEELKPKPAADNFIDLHCVTIYAGKKPIGLDQSEYIIKPPETSFVHEDHPKHVPISFCGTLEIRDLSWLSKKGRLFLERDVRNHDKAIVPNNKERREISLEQVLNSTRRGQSFKVYLLCRKSLLAHYLTAKSRPHELLIYSSSADGLVNRKFAVKSLHVESYVASKTFLARYRLRALLAELSEIDNNQTPVHLKDYSWVVNSYLTHILPRDMDAERRRKLRPIAELSPYADDLRHPRHIPLSQLHSELAEHSEWILANHIGKQGSVRDVPKSLIYVPSWINWCAEAYSASVEAKRNGVVWGLSESVDLKKQKRNSMSQRLAEFGESETFWKLRLQAWVKCSKRYVDENRDKPVLPARAIQPGPPAAYGGLEYDSDFSPDYTSSEWSDSDNIETSEISGALKEVWFCAQPPQIPLGHFVWHCPGQGCQKAINLLDPSREDIALLPQDLARKLQTKRWRTQDISVKQALAAMVSHHYQHEHLAMAGFHQGSTKIGPRFQLSEALRKPNPRKRAMLMEIKDEDSS